MSSSAKPTITSYLVRLFNGRYAYALTGIKQRECFVLPAPANLHDPIDLAGGVAADITTGFVAMPSPSRPVRISLTGMGAVGGKVTLTVKRFGQTLDRVITIAPGDTDDVIAFDEITRLRTDTAVKGTLTLKTGLGWGLANPANDAEEFAIDGVRGTVDMDWTTGTVRTTTVPDGTKRFSIVYTPRFE